MNKKIITKVVSVLLLTTLVSGCDVYEDNTINFVHKTKDRIDNISGRVNARLNDYDQMVNSDNFSFLEPYAEKEKWRERIEDSINKAPDIKRHYDRNVLPLLKDDLFIPFIDDKSKLAQGVNLHREATESLEQILEIDERMNYPFERAKELLEVRDNLKSYSGNVYEKIQEIMQIDKNTTDLTISAINDLPGSKGEINTSYQNFKLEVQNSIDIYNNFVSELKKDYNNRDYALIADTLKMLNEHKEITVNESSKLLKSIERNYIQMGMIPPE